MLDVNLSFLIVKLVTIETTFPSKCTRMSDTSIQLCSIEPTNKEKERKIVNKTNRLSSLEANGCSTLPSSQKIKLKLDTHTEMARKMSYQESHNPDTWKEYNLKSRVILLTLKKCRGVDPISLSSTRSQLSITRSTLVTWVTIMSQHPMTTPGR